MTRMNLIKLYSSELKIFNLFLFFFIIFFLIFPCSCNHTYYWNFENGSLNGLEFEGNPSWYLDTSEGHDGYSSMRSGNIYLLGHTSMYRQVRAPIVISFAWKTSPSQICPSPSALKNGLLFMVDGKVQIECCSSTWEELRYYINDNNTHRIEWRYNKGTRDWNGTGWVDSIYMMIPEKENITENFQESVVSSLISDKENQTLIDVSEERPAEIQIPTEIQIQNKGKGQIIIVDNNSLNIVNAIYYAYNNSIKNILIKNGSYFLNKSLVLYKPICLEGEHSGKVIINSTSKNFSALRVMSDDCEIRNLSFTDFGLGIDLTYSSNATIANNNFTNIEGIYIINGKNITINNNSFNSVKNAIFIKSGENVEITRNKFSGINGSIILNSKEIIFKNNDLLDLRNFGISLRDSSGLKLYYNNLKSNSNKWFIIDDHDSAQIDCNFWEDFSRGASCRESPPICDSSCLIKCLDGSPLSDSHPYCFKEGWKK